jgi:hypothetical protein
MKARVNWCCHQEAGCSMEMKCEKKEAGGEEGEECHRCPDTVHRSSNFCRHPNERDPCCRLARTWTALLQRLIFIPDRLLPTPRILAQHHHQANGRRKPKWAPETGSGGGGPLMTGRGNRKLGGGSYSFGGMLLLLYKAKQPRMMRESKPFPASSSSSSSGEIIWANTTMTWTAGVC